MLPPNRNNNNNNNSRGRGGGGNGADHNRYGNRGSNSSINSNSGSTNGGNLRGRASVGNVNSSDNNANNEFTADAMRAVEGANSGQGTAAEFRGTGAPNQGGASGGGGGGGFGLQNLFDWAGGGFSGYNPRNGGAHNAEELRNENSFRRTYRCYPASRMPSSDVYGLDYSSKIVLPPSALVRLGSLNMEYPMLFSLRRDDMQDGPVTHSGVLEFTAEEGRVYMPRWMMDSLCLETTELVLVENTTLRLGTFVKIEPQSCDFLDIHDPRAVLEHAFRSYTTLTVNDTICFMYNDKKYEIKILELKPDDAVLIIETDLEVDFAPPKGYVEPKYTPKTAGHAASSSHNASSFNHNSVSPGQVLGCIGAPHAAATLQMGSSSQQHGPSSTAAAAVAMDSTPASRVGEKRSAKKTATETNAQASVSKSHAEGGSSDTERLTLLLQNPVPRPLRLPTGHIFFGFPVVPPPAKKDSESSSSTPSSKPPPPSDQGTSSRRLGA